MNVVVPAVPLTQTHPSLIGDALVVVAVNNGVPEHVLELSQTVVVYAPSHGAAGDGGGGGDIAEAEERGVSKSYDTTIGTTANIRK